MSTTNQIRRSYQDGRSVCIIVTKFWEREYWISRIGPTCDKIIYLLVVLCRP